MSVFEIASATAGWLGMITSFVALAIEIRSERRARAAREFHDWFLKTNRELADQ